MKIRELVNYSAKIIKGKRAGILLVCLLPVCGELFFRLAEAAMYSILLYFSDMKPAGLFMGENTGQLAIAVLCTFFRWVCFAPLAYASAVRLSEICQEMRKYTPVSKILVSRRIFKRSFSALLLTKLISAAIFVPVVFLVIMSYSLLIADDIFPAVHCAAAAIASLIFWINTKISLLSVYFLMARYPDRGVFRTIIHSFRFMKGRQKYILRLAALYFFPIILIVPVPFLLPEIMTAFSLSISIFLKEDEYFERNKVYSKDRKADNRSELSHRKKRRFKKTPYKAETA